MIRVTISHEDRDGTVTELAAMRITRIEPTFDEAVYADYQVESVFDNNESMKIRNTVINNFPRKHLNVMGLLSLALHTFSQKDVTLDGDLPSGHMARRQRRALPAFPRRKD